MKKVGDTISLGKGTYTLEKYLGGGVEGSVFQITNKGREFAVKILNTDNLSDEQQTDIKRHLVWIRNLVVNCPELGERIVYPLAFVNDGLGYAMRYTGDHDNLKTYLSFPTDAQKFNEWYKTKYNLKKRYQIIESLFKTLELIHINGLLFTDISPNNIMVHKTQNNTMFIDIDNIRTKTDEFLNVYGTEGYMAPEIYINEKNKNPRFDTSTLAKKYTPRNGRLTAESDVFAAAIIAFQLLTLQHPFVGDKVEDGTAEEEAAALRCETDYILHENGLNESTSLPFVKFLKDEIISTKKINELFYKTFVVGKDNPMLRPTANEFAEAFSEGLDHIVCCKKCGQYRIYNPNEENFCWDCGEKFNKKIVIEIYSQFQEPNRDLLVDQILEKPRNNQLNPLEYTPNVLMTSLVIDDDNHKFIYSRHLEWRINRDVALCEVKVSDLTSGEIAITMMKNEFIQKVYVRNFRNGHVYDAEYGKQKLFNYRDHEIVMENLKSRVGRIYTLLLFKEL